MSGTRAIGLVLLLALGACSNGPNSPYEDFGERVNVEGFGHRYAQLDDQGDDLVAGIGDVLQIDVAGIPELSGQQTVRFGGVVTAPYVGDVQVAGLTMRQIENKLTALVLPFISDLVVRVTPIEIVSKNVYLFSNNLQGALVARKFPLVDDLTLVDLVAESLGGLPQGIDDCHIKVMRGDPRHPQKWVINLRDIVRNGYTAGNIRMRPDDMVWLPPTLFAKITATLFEVTQPMRVLRQAISEVDDVRTFVEEGELDRRRRY